MNEARVWTLPLAVKSEPMDVFPGVKTTMAPTRVIELEPVLDLLEGALRWMPARPRHWPKDSVEDTYRAIETILRTNGRLR